MGKKVAITGDWHIHPHAGSMRVLQSCVRSADWVVSEAIKRGCEALLHLGDVYDDREYVHVVALDAISSTFSRATALGLQTYILLGNHDMFGNSTESASSISHLCGTASVISSPSSMDIFGRQFHWMPYTESPAADLAKAFPLAERKDAILLGHFSVSDAVTNGLYNTKYVARGESADEHAVMFDGWAAGWLGHFHKRQVLPFAPHVKYQGSIQQLTMAEAGDEKGFSILDVETLEEEFIENAVAPKYFVFASFAEAIATDVPEGQHLRVKLSESDDVERSKAKAELTERFRPISCVVTPKEYKSPVDAGAMEFVVGSSVEKASGLSEGMDVLVLMSDHTEVARRYAKLCAMPHEELAVGIEIIRSAS